MDRSAIKRHAESANREERRKAERLIRISKKLKVGVVFATGKGCLNKIVVKNNNHIFIRALNGTKVAKVPLKNVQKMFAYFYRIRIVDRQELGTFHNYSSSLFGLLYSVFKKVARVNKNGNSLRLIMSGIRIFLAGADKCPKDLKMAADAGAKYVLMSYYYIRTGTAWKRHLENLGLKMLLDCGKFSEWCIQNKKGNVKNKLDIEEYISFIKKNLDVIEAYFVMDEVGSYEQTDINLKRMEGAGLNPIPVYHMGSPIEALDDLVKKEYPLIAIGGTVGQSNVKDFMLRVFNRCPNQAFHGLGVTNQRYLNTLPWFSTDSTTWLRCRIKKILLTRNGQRKGSHISLEERVKKSIKFLKSMERPQVFKKTPALGYQSQLFA